MTVLLGRGESGSHVTLIFTVNDDSTNLDEQGSLGAGLCLEHGVETIARGIEGDFGINVEFIQGNGNSELYEKVLRLLSKDITNIKNYNWDLAAIGEPHEKSLRRALAIAHRVERSRSTGLGDVTALAAGGVERRISPGSPFSSNLLSKGPGISEGWVEDIDVILAWKNDSGKHTSSYIDSPAWKDAISKAGIKQMNELSKNDWHKGRWGELLERSEAFAKESGLLSDSRRFELVKDAENIINLLALEFKPLLCMLGESLVIVPKEIGRKNNLEISEIIYALNDIGFMTQKTRVKKLF
jgi:pantoate kinase